MPTEIVNLELVIQSPVSNRARKNVVRREKSDGPFRNRSINLKVNIPIGPDSGANFELRRAVAGAVKQFATAEDYTFYVVAEFKREDNTRHFKTVVGRTQIPLQFRGV